MTKVSNKMISSLLALIMVLGIMAVPAMPALEAEAAVLPDPEATRYVWDFDNSIINPDVEPVVYNGVQRGKYENGELVNFINNYFGEVKNPIKGGEYDSYFLAGSNNDTGSNAKMALVDDASGGKMLRISTTDATQNPYIAIEFPQAVTGAVDVQFKARIGKLVDGEIVSVPKAYGQIVTINNVSNGKPYINLPTNQDGNMVVNANKTNTNDICEYDGCTGTSNRIAPNNGTFADVKMHIDYENGYANAYNEGKLITCSAGHATEFGITGTGLNKIYFGFMVDLAGCTLNEGETLIYDIDEIIVSSEPEPLEATNTLHEWNFNDSIVNPDVEAVTVSGKKRGTYDNGEIVNFANNYFGEVKNLLKGGEYDSYITAASNNSSGANSKIGLVADGSGGKMLRISTPNPGTATTNENPYIALVFPEALTGAMDIEFDARIGKLVEGEIVSTPKAFGQLLSTNSVASGKPYINFPTNQDGNIVLNANKTNTNDVCGYDSCTGTANRLAANNGTLVKLKMHLDYDNGYANAYNAGTLITCSAGHATQFGISGTGLNKVYIGLVNIGGSGLNEGETLILDIDNIRITTEPVVGAPVANVENGDNDVAVDEVFEVDFGMDISESEYAAVKLLDAEGVEVTAGKKLVGTKVVITPVDELDYNADYKLTIPQVKRKGTDADVVYEAQTIEFTTSETIAQVGITANIYATEDTEFTTPLEALTVGADVTAVVDFTGDANVNANNIIMYIGVYAESGKLLLAAASEGDIAAGGTQQLTATFTVPADADHIKIFAWNKYLTPHSLPEILFN